MCRPRRLAERKPTTIGAVFCVALACTVTPARASHVLSSAEHVVIDGLRCANTASETVRFAVDEGRARVIEPADVTCTTTGPRTSCRGLLKPEVDVLTCAPVISRGAPETLFVLDVMGADDDDGQALTRMATSVIIERAARSESYAVLSAGDVRALLDHAGARAAFDIDDTPALGVMGEALSARVLLASTLSTSDGLLVMRLRLIDVEATRVVGHARADGRDAFELFRRLRVSVDDLLSGRDAPLPAVDLGRRVDDAAALTGALLTAALAGGTLAVFGAMPVAAATLARGSSAPVELTTPTFFCCACTSACSVPAAVLASLAVDRGLGYEAGIWRATIVGLSGAAALALAPAVPLSLLIVVFLTATLSNPNASDDELTALAGPPAILAMAAGVLVAPVMAFAAVFVGYEVGIAFFGDTPVAALPGDE